MPTAWNLTNCFRQSYQQGSARHDDRCKRKQPVIACSAGTARVPFPGPPASFSRKQLRTNAERVYRVDKSSAILVSDLKFTTWQEDWQTQNHPFSGVEADALVWCGVRLCRQVITVVFSEQPSVNIGSERISLRNCWPKRRTSIRTISAGSSVARNTFRSRRFAEWQRHSASAYVIWFPTSDNHSREPRELDLPIESGRRNFYRRFNRVWRN